MKRLLLLVGLFFLPLYLLQGQDTLRMMQYNLMYYTDNSGVSDCNASTNNLNNKDANIKTIFHYVMPDVFCVCEMGTDNRYVERLLNNAINVNGINYYRHAPLTNYSGGYIANMMYYDSRKLTLYDTYYITTSYRDINGYKMYYNSTDLSGGDTVFITFWIMHLKAGTGSSNESARHAQTQRFMNRITMDSPGNNVVSGDFNINGASENAYQELVNYSNTLYRFYDPIDSEGEWNNNSSFAAIHTQSTHSSNDGCFASGGLDDRFDIILVSPYIYYGSKGVQVLPNTYHALGQDGHRFNGSIISPGNNSVPTNVAQALYNQSDHLPVITDFIIEGHVGVQDYAPAISLNVVNPVQDCLAMVLQAEEAGTYTFDIYASDGKLLQSDTRNLESGAQNLRLPFPFERGFYLLKITDSKHRSQVWKLMK